MVVIKSEGNPAGHIILRGGTRPTYHQSDVEEAAERLARQGLTPRLMVDCSHGNSQKLHKNQIRVAGELCRQLGKAATPSPPSWSRALQGGSQKPAPLAELVYGQSVTDACLCWDDTQILLAMLAEAVETRRQHPGRAQPTSPAGMPSWPVERPSAIRPRDGSLIILPIFLPCRLLDLPIK